MIQNFLNTDSSNVTIIGFEFSNSLVIGSLFNLQSSIKEFNSSFFMASTNFLSIYQSSNQGMYYTLIFLIYYLIIRFHF